MLLRAAPDPFELAARRFEKKGASRWLYDPLGFIDTCVDFGYDEDGSPRTLTSYQREAINDLVVARRYALRGPHGLGKTAIEALVVLWFALTREDALIDWKVITTAAAWRQLSVYLWPEIHKWAGKLRWEHLNRGSFDPIHELQALNLKLGHGAASAVASSKKELIEGAHADSLLYIFEESKAIDADIFDAAEGAFSGDKRIQGKLPEAFGLMVSTPGDTAGRFYEIHTGRKGTGDWTKRWVRVQEAVKAGRISAQWIQDRKEQWGEDSAVFQNRVLGEFYSNETDVVIPLKWVEDAMDRWQYWSDEGCPVQFGRRVVGVDVARGGADLTILADRIGAIVYPLTKMKVGNTMLVYDEVVRRLVNQTDLSVVDVIGVGAGVVDLLRRNRKPVHAFNAARACGLRDRSGTYGFRNQRSAMWWTAREMLDPAFNPTLALPPDDDLLGELTAPKFQYMTGAIIQVESKDEIKKRIGRSTDHADAVCQSLLTDVEFNQVDSTEPSAFEYTDPAKPSKKTESNTGSYQWE